MAVLTILSGKLQGKRLTLPEGEIVVGRDETCQIRLSTTEISRFHCKIICRNESVTVKDLGSRNGTIINDVPIHREQSLEPGDVLRVGPVSFQLVGKKTSPSEPVSAEASRKKGGPSDDSIMNWLADEEEVGPGDTTIVRKYDSPNSKPPQKEAVVDERPTPSPPTEKKKYKTIGEEGEDIIQRHFELVQDGKLPKRIPALTTDK